ncbi:MAG: hypothetical protein U5K84_09230 [Alkalibacterium sp.]|nr:hypothetical protein [Alkalibacterium sp.]
MNVPGATSLMLRQFAGMLEQQRETAVIHFTGEELTAGPGR